MTAIVPSQTRAPLHHAIQQHAQPPASTLVSDQSKVYAADFDVDKVDLDLFLIDTTAGNVEATLLAGAKYHAGKVYKFQKTASANTMKVTAYGTEEIEGSGDIDITAENGMLAIQWDPHAETWRRAYPGQATGANDGFALDDLSNVDEIVGRDALGVGKAYLQVRVATLVGTGVYRILSPYAGTITSIKSITEGALTTGDATLTGKIGGVAITTGVVTITQAGSAAGDKDSCTPSAANVVAVGDEISLTVGGTNATATVANCLIEITLDV